MRVLPAVELWLDSDADSWSLISDDDYIALIRRWRETFLDSIAAQTPSMRGNHTLTALTERLPADVSIFSGLQIPESANAGSQGPAGYQVGGLRNIHRELANRLELIVAAKDFSWTCVFSHEAGAYMSECLFERYKTNP